MPQFPPTGWDVYGLSASDTSVFLAAVLVMVLIVVFVSRYGTVFACGFWAFLGTTWFCLNLEFVLQRTSLAEPRVPLDVGLRLTALFAIGVGFVKTLRINSKLRADGGMAAMVGTFAALLLFGIPLLLSPQVSYAYPASRRTQCRNNLKQIGLALHNYHDHWNTFPQAAISKPPVSWRVNILPFAVHSDLYKQYDDSFAWDSQVNLPLSFERIRALQCPSRPKRTETNQQGQWFTSYTAPLGPGSVLGGLGSVRIRDIADGTSSTILVVESCGTAIV